MAAGINLPNLMSIAYSVSSNIIIRSAKAYSDAEREAFESGTQSSGRWSPPEWSKPALTIITIPVSPATIQQAVNVGGDDTNLAAVLAGTPTNYVFDAVLRASHRRSLRKTSHPVLTGANISDHAYIEPAKLTLEIGMSDAMAAFPSNGAWVGGATKSISAWQVLKTMQQNRTVLIITTRLDTYYNMLVEECSTQDDSRTLHGLRATISFGELIAASVTSQALTGTLPQTSGDASTGLIQGMQVDPSQTEQHEIPSTLYPDVEVQDGVYGAGDVSSNSLGQTP